MRFILFLLLFLIDIRILNASNSFQQDLNISTIQSKNIILFIHGLSGDPDDTWTNRKSKTSWIKMFNNDKDLIESKFYSLPYGYESGFLKRGESLHELSGTLIQELDKFSANGAENIYIISHSMGGLIAASALNRMDTENKVDLANKIKCIFFISAPFGGINLNRLIRRFLFSRQIIDLYKREQTSFLPGLRTRLRVMRDNRIAQRKTYPSFYSCYEKKNTYLFFRIVPEEFCIQNYDDIIGVEKNHKTIAKPFDQTDETYHWVKQNIIKVNDNLRNSAMERNYEKEGIKILFENFQDELHHNWQVLIAFENLDENSTLGARFDFVSSDKIRHHIRDRASRDGLIVAVNDMKSANNILEMISSNTYDQIKNKEKLERLLRNIKQNLGFLLNNQQVWMPKFSSNE